MMQTGNIAFSGTATAAPAGGGQGHENRQPFLALSYCIALAGVFPARP
jgi:microcystin-dependent protein